MKLKLSPFIILIGICLIANIFLAFFFRLERVIMPDMAFHLFEIIHKEDFAIQNLRYGAILTQIFPLIGVKLNLPLKTIVSLYSVSFPILYFLIYLLLIIFKSERYIVLLFLYLFTMTTHSFFWPLSEIHLGSVLLILYLAILDFYRFDIQKIPFIIFTLILLPTIIFLYPLLIIFLGFVLIYFYFVKQETKGVYFLGSFISICLLLKVFVFSSHYDNQTMSRAFNLKNYLIFYSLKSTKLFLGQTFVSYYLWLISFLSIVFVFIKRKIIRPLLLLLGFNLVIIILVNVSYPNGGEPFYFEGQYNQLIFYLGFIVVNEFNLIKKSGVVFSILLLFFGLFVLRVNDVSKYYKDRINLYQELIEIKKGKKVIIRETAELLKILGMTWCSSFETWLLSTFENGSSSSIIISENPNKFKSDLNKKNTWITEWETIDYENLNPKYFVFRDTGTYELK